MATEHEPDDEKIIPDVGADKAKVEGVRLWVTVGGVIFGVLALFGVGYGLYKTVGSTLSQSVESLAHRGDAADQGVVTTSAQLNLQEQAEKSAQSRGKSIVDIEPPSSGVAARAASTRPPVVHGTRRHAHRPVHKRVAAAPLPGPAAPLVTQQVTSPRCPTGSHLEPRFKADGTAIDTCVANAAKSGPAAAAPAVMNPLNAPLVLDEASSASASVAGAVSGAESAVAHAVAPNTGLAALQAADAGIARSAAAAEGAVGAGAKGRTRQTGYHLNEQFKAVPLRGVSATRLGNLSLIWAKGEGANCVLDGRIDTTLSGYVTCTVSDDVYSANGETVLVPKGSMGFVEYKSVTTDGQSRFAAIVTSIRTPNGVTFQLDSGAQGRLGESGVGGYLDNRWGERLGAALVIALVSDVAQYEENKALSGGGSGTTVVQPSNTVQALSSMPQEVLRSTLRIRPRIIKTQGDTIRIVAARDINFATVYRLVNVDGSLSSTAAE